MKEYQYYLFDWDGCLAKTLEVWLDAYKQSIADYGKHPLETEIARHLGDWELPKYFDVKEYRQCNLEAMVIARENLKEVELYDGAKNLLELLHGNKKLAIISSSSKEVLYNGLVHNNLEQMFDVILSGDDVQYHKPHPEVILKGLETLNGNKDSAVMIGDSRKDLGAAKNAGIDSVLMLHDSHKLFYDFSELKTHNPTYTFNTFHELKASIFN